MNKKVKLLIAALLLIFLPASVYVSQKVADYQKGAAGDTVGLSVLPSEKEVTVDEASQIKITMDSGQNKVDVVDLVLTISADEDVLDWQQTELVPITGADQAFDQNSKAEVGEVNCRDSECNQKLKIISVATRNNADLKSGVLDIAKINLVGQKNGEVKVNFDSQDGQVSGPEGILEINITSNGVYTVIPAEDEVHQRSVNLTWSPSNGSQLVLDKPFFAYLRLESEHKIDVAELSLKYDPEKLRVDSASLNQNNWGDDQNQPFVFVEEIDSQSGEVNLGIGAGDESLAKSKINFATLRLTPLVVGPVDLEIISSDISGFNAENPDNSGLSLKEGKKINWSVVGAGDNPEMTFKIKLGGTTYNVGDEEKTIDTIPSEKVVVVVKKDDFEKKFQTNVSFDEQAVGTGNLVLTNVPPGDNYLILIKGPKHLANRYCSDKQDGHCWLGEEDITLKKGENVFDWTDHELKPGDLNQDGVVNSNDFSQLKKALGQKGENIPEDLNYNGQVNSQDLVFFLNTLNSRYEDEI